MNPSFAGRAVRPAVVVAVVAMVVVVAVVAIVLIVVATGSGNSRRRSGSSCKGKVLVLR